MLGEINSAHNLKSNEIAILKAASVRVDTFQDPKDSFMHAMRSPKQTIPEAMALYENYINTRLNDAVKLAVAGDGNNALARLGEGMHSLMDNTSPSHRGFQEWRGILGPIATPSALIHISKELFITKPVLNETADALRNYYVCFENSVVVELGKINASKNTKNDTPQEPRQIIHKK